MRGLLHTVRGLGFRMTVWHEVLAPSTDKSRVGVVSGPWANLDLVLTDQPFLAVALMSPS